jgi:hypothetical protein
VNASRRYDAAAAAARRPGPVGGRDDRELVRLATLAASSHNTQPWRFHVAADAITITPDRTRRCPVVDPDDAHLYRSLGCAAENLVHAASTQGLSAQVRYEEAADAVVVRLEPSPEVGPTDLSEALTTRQCTRADYDGVPVADEDLGALVRTAASEHVRVRLLTDAADLTHVVDLVERGNQAQLTDRRFRRELVRWIRFDPGSAVRTGDGLAGRVNRQPPLPTTVGRLLAGVLIRAAGQAATDTARLWTSAGVAVFLTGTDTRADWVEAGRAYERFSLRADLLGIRSAFLNQPIEVPPLRTELRAFLDTAEHPQLMVRFGRAPRAPYSLRRPLEDVLAS